MMTLIVCMCLRMRPYSSHVGICACMYWYRLLVSISLQDMKDMVLMTLKEWLTDSSTANNPVLQTVAGIIYLELNELEEAAKVLHSGTTLEMVSLQVQVTFHLLPYMHFITT